MPWQSEDPTPSRLPGAGCPRTHKPTEKIILDHKQKEKTYEKH